MIAVVTGAGVRVGRAVALALAEAGYDLVLHAHGSGGGAAEVARAAEKMGRKAEVRLADLSDPAGVDRLGVEIRAAHPVIDLLVHNAGVFERIPFPSIGRDAYRRMLAINLDAPFFLSQALLPSLRAAKDGLIVHLADIGGERPAPKYAHYSVSKAGVEMLTKALAVELAPGVRVNAVAPGTVAFPANFDPDARASVLARVPMGREGSPEDVAQAILYLARARYVTGHVLTVDGGRSAVL